MGGRLGDGCDSWLIQEVAARACRRTTLRSTLHAAVTLPYNSGVAEGRITDLKMIKRQMAGRAGIWLLRKRVILVAHSRRSHRPLLDDDLWVINGYESLV